MKGLWGWCKAGLELIPTRTVLLGSPEHLKLAPLKGVRVPFKGLRGSVWVDIFFKSWCKHRDAEVHKVGGLVGFRV